jgi:hypothetical protein
VAKRYLIQVAGHNLGILMRKLFGIGTPRSLQGSSGAVNQLDEGLPFAFPSILNCVERILWPEWSRHHPIGTTQAAA